MSIHNARPTMISTTILAHLEYEGVVISTRHKQVIHALFDPNVGPDLVDHLLGPQPWIKYATCRSCGRDVHITKAGTIRKHRNEDYSSETRTRCPGSGTTNWTI